MMTKEETLKEYKASTYVKGKHTDDEWRKEDIIIFAENLGLATKKFKEALIQLAISAMEAVDNMESAMSAMEEIDLSQIVNGTNFSEPIPDEFVDSMKMVKEDINCREYDDRVRHQPKRQHRYKYSGTYKKGKNQIIKRKGKRR